MPTARRVGLVLCAGAAALYAAACACPAAGFGDGVAVPGWAALLVGSGLVTGLSPPCHVTPAALSWLANPAALAGAACLARGRRASGAAFGLTGLALGLLFFVPAAVQPRAGAYLWAGSLAAFAAAAPLVWAGGTPDAQTTRAADRRRLTG